MRIFFPSSLRDCLGTRAVGERGQLEKLSALSRKPSSNRKNSPATLFKSEFEKIPSPSPLNGRSPDGVMRENREKLRSLLPRLHCSRSRKNTPVDKVCRLSFFIAPLPYPLEIFLLIKSFRCFLLIFHTYFSFCSSAVEDSGVGLLLRAKKHFMPAKCGRYIFSYLETVRMLVTGI